MNKTVAKMRHKNSEPAKLSGMSPKGFTDSTHVVMETMPIAPYACEVFSPTEMEQRIAYFAEMADLRISLFSVACTACNHGLVTDAQATRKCRVCGGKGHVPRIVPGFSPEGEK